MPHRPLALALVVAGCGGATSPAPAPDGGACASPIGAVEQPLCSAGWCWDYPRPDGAPLRAISGTGASDAWAVEGELATGTILHFDGSAWLAVPSGTSAPLDGVAAIAPGDAWAVGAGGAIVHWDCRAFTAVASGTTRDLHAVAASGPGDVWAVGDGGTILHGDGARFTAVPSPTSANLRAVAASSASEAWAVGDGGTVLRFDGKAWSAAHPTPNEQASFRGVAIAGGNVWVVGESVTGGGALRAFDGASWRATDDPRGPAWNAVFATGPGAFVAVGDAGASGASIGFGGPSGITRASAGSAALFGVWGTGPDDLLAVGAGGAIERWNGSAWSPLRGGAPIYPMRLASSSPSDVWAAGSGPRGASVARWDGSSWTVLDASGVGMLVDLWAAAPSDAWAIAGSTIFHFDGRAWTPAFDTGGLANALRAIWGTSASDVWAIDEAHVYHFGGAAWSLQSDRSADGYLRDLWASVPGDLWLVGLSADGTAPLLLHGDGATWTPVASPVTATDIGGAPPLVEVRGTGPGDVWALGAPSSTNDFLLHFDGKAWSHAAIPPTNAAHLAALSPNEVWLFGGAPPLRWDGATWSPASLWGADLQDLLAADATHVFAAAATADGTGFLARRMP